MKFFEVKSKSSCGSFISLCMPVYVCACVDEGMGVVGREKENVF